MLPETIAAKIAGTLSGTIVALVFIPPKTLFGFARRAAASIIVGPIAGPVFMAWMEWPSTFDNIVAATAICSFASWWLLGAGLGALRKAFDAKAE